MIWACAHKRTDKSHLKKSAVQQGVQHHCRAEDKRASQTHITSNQTGPPSVDRQKTDSISSQSKCTDTQQLGADTPTQVNSIWPEVLGSSTPDLPLRACTDALLIQLLCKQDVYCLLQTRGGSVDTVKTRSLNMPHEEYLTGWLLDR